MLVLFSEGSRRAVTKDFRPYADYIKELVTIWEQFEPNRFSPKTCNASTAYITHRVQFGFC